MVKKMNFYIEKLIWTNSFGVHIAQTSGGKRALLTNLEFTYIDEGAVAPESVLKLTSTEAQELADQLYAAGVRPSAAAGSAGQIDAVKNHLEDMRTLVFNGKPKP